MPFLDFGAACTTRFAAVPSSLQPLIPRLQNLIANLELEFRVTPIRINKLQFSNRKFFAISAFPNRAAYRKSQATKVLIENARLNSELTGKDSNRLQISNRERIDVSCSAALSQSSPLPIPSSNLQVSNPEPPTSPSHSRHMHRHPLASRFSAVLCFVRFEEEERMKQSLGGFACASRKVAILIAMFMLASGAAWAQKKPKNKAADQSPMPKVPMSVSDEIDKDISEMLAAFQLGKVEMMHKYYSENAVFVSGAFAPPIVGWQNYVEDYKRSLAAFQGMQLIRRNTDVFVHGDIAWASYQWEFLSSYQNKPYSAHGQTTLILQKIGDGWLIVHNHTSQVCDQVPEQPQQPQPAAQNPTAPTPAKPQQ